MQEAQIQGPLGPQWPGALSFDFPFHEMQTVLIPLTPSEGTETKLPITCNHSAFQEPWVCCPVSSLSWLWRKNLLGPLWQPASVFPILKLHGSASTFPSWCLAFSLC